MRPRFSLKWLLIAVTVLSVVFYALFIHPTISAHRFVDAVNSGDFSGVKELRAGGSGSSTMLEDLQSWNKEYTFENCKVSAELKPRTWRDVNKFRRIVWIHIAFPPGIKQGPTSLDNVLVVHINGVTWGGEP
jgi:hypothetical protein